MLKNIAYYAQYYAHKYCNYATVHDHIQINYFYKLD